MPSQVQKVPADIVEFVPILRLLSEQQAVQIDHLSGFLDLYVSDMARVVEQLRIKGLVVVEELLRGKSPWVSVTSRGARFSGTGLQVLKPSIARLPHLRAINEARLVMTRRFPGSRWVCERDLRRHWHRKKFRNIPDGVLENGGKRWAVEVELSRKPIETVRANVREHVARYDRVFYLCSNEVARFIERQGLMNEFSKGLLVWGLFDSTRTLRPAEFQSLAPAHSRYFTRRSPKPSEVPLLDLLAEQGAVPEDQLARFLKCDLKEVTTLAASLFEAGFVNCSRPLGNEGDWFWLTGTGAKASTTGLHAYTPKLGGLARRRALNEIRLLLAEQYPAGRWMSDRTLRKAAGPKGQLPGAVLKIGTGSDCERHAIDVCLTSGVQIQERMELYKAGFDAAMVFCTPHTEKLTERSAARCRWPKLRVLLVPGSDEYLSFPDSRVGRTLPFEPAELGVVIERLREAVAAERLQPSRARSLVGYLLLRKAGVPQGEKRTQYALQADCRKLALLADSTPSMLSGRSVRHAIPADLDDVLECARHKVAEGFLPPSRARTVVGFFLLKSVGVPQGAERTVYELERAYSELRS